MAVTLDIQEQPRLPVAKQIEICRDGVRHRLFRSTVTLSVVVLAIAFLMNVLTESVTAHAMLKGVAAEAARVRQLAAFGRFFSAPTGADAMRQRVLESTPGTWRANTLAAWLEMDEGRYGELYAACRSAHALRQWFGRLSIADRRLLFGSRSIETIIDDLALPAEADAFEAALQTIPTLSLDQELLAFARTLPAFEEQLGTSAKRVAEKIDALTAEMPHATLIEWLADASGRDALVAHQVTLPDAVIDDLSAMARQSREEERLTGALSDPRLAAAWRTKFGDLLDQHDAMVRLADDEATAQWFANEIHADASAWIGETARRMARARAITQTADQLDATYGQDEGMGGNVVWLIVVSLLVCVVGITNAMLISVIERFREIATMKCLGALDGFIATLFIMEAALLGLVGGAAGVIVGAIIGLGRMWFGYGEWVGRFFPRTGLLAAAGASIAAGLALATVAAMYPAFRASKMPPMEAMRVE